MSPAESVLSVASTMSAASEGCTARERERDRKREPFAEKIQAKEKDLEGQVVGDPCADLDSSAAEEEPSNGHMSSQYTHLGHEDDDEEEASSLPLTGTVIPGLQVSKQGDSDDQGSLEVRVRKHLRRYHVSAYSPR